MAPAVVHVTFLHVDKLIVFLASRRHCLSLVLRLTDFYVFQSYVDEIDTAGSRCF